MTETFSRSMSLAVNSWKTLKYNAKLLVFTILTFIILILFPLFIQAIFNFDFRASGTSLHSIQASVFFIGYSFVTSLTVLIFNSGLIFCIDRRLQGEKTGLGSSLKAAVRKIIPLALWALLATVIGIVSQNLLMGTAAINNYIKIIAFIAYFLAFFFVVPIITLENKNPIKAMIGSLQMIKKIWKELLVSVLIFVIIFLLLLLPTLLGVILMTMILKQQLVAGSLLMILLGILLVYTIALLCLHSTLLVILQTSLYIYGTTGKIASISKNNALKGSLT